MTGDQIPLELGHEQRGDRRHRVHLEVRFGSARDFVVEYAQNLSRGGLFVRGDFDLSRDEIVPLCLELPGFHRFEVTARVVHVCRSPIPGVGVQLVESPPLFSDALHQYLDRLGHRRDFAVLTTDQMVRAVLDAAGYRALAAPPPGEVAPYADTLPQRVLALVLGRGERFDYTRAEDIPHPIVDIDFLTEIDEILRMLDDLMVEAIEAYAGGVVQVAR